MERCQQRLSEEHVTWGIGYKCRRSSHRRRCCCCLGREGSCSPCNALVMTKPEAPFAGLLLTQASVPFK